MYLSFRSVRIIRVKFFLLVVFLRLYNKLLYVFLCVL